MATGEKILIVEDEKSLLQIYTTYLTSKGLQIVSANDGEEALKAVNEPGLQLVLLDIRIPKIDGLTVLKEIRKNKNFDKLPIYMMSVLGSSEVSEQATKAGADGYLVKDALNPEELRQEILKAIEKGRG